MKYAIEFYYYIVLLNAVTARHLTSYLPYGILYLGTLFSRHWREYKGRG